MQSEMKIRRRERTMTSPATFGYKQYWVEYQVVKRRKILARCGTELEAIAALVRIERTGSPT